MKRISIFAALLMIFIPSILLADDELKTGYDLYHYINLRDDAQTPEEITGVLHTTGYLAGYLDALVLVQDVLFNTMLPSKYLSEEERKKIAKELNFHRINIPDSGLAPRQTMLIYEKFAEKYPEKLNVTARTCLLEALINSYGWE